MQIKLNYIGKEEKRLLRKIGVEIERNWKKKIYVISFPRTIKIMNVLDNLYFIETFDGVELGQVWSPFDNNGGTLVLNLANVRKLVEK